MPKSSSRIIDRSIGATWLLPEVSADDIWNAARLERSAGGEHPPEWFAMDVGQCVVDYLRYASKIETSPKPNEFTRKMSKLSDCCRQIVETVNSANLFEKRHLTGVASSIMPDIGIRDPLHPESHPEVFLKSFVRRIGEFADALDAYLVSIRPMREQKTNELEPADDAFQRPFDLFVEKMSAIANRLGVSVSASKDWGSPSPFVDLVRATLSEYCAAVERLTREDWEAPRRAGYARMKLRDGDIDRLIQEEKDGDAFALKLLANHVETPAAAASAIADALARIRAKQARVK